MKYTKRNKDKEEQTASPKKYPQGYFKDKPCKNCSNDFKPNAPSEHYCSNTCKDRGLHSNYLKNNYGITTEDYERMLSEQDNKCKICLGSGFSMKKEHKVLLVVDHCHTTGRVRGLLCHNCNRALGLLKDKEDNLLRAIEYLKV